MIMMLLNEYLNEQHIRDMRREAERIRQNRCPDRNKHEIKRAQRLMSDLLHLN